MTNEVFGRPIHGDIPVARIVRVTQKDPQLFMDALDKLLAIDGVESVKWDQYTPSWNDGEPCEFGVNEVYVKLEGLEEGGDYDNGYLSNFDIRYHSDAGYDSTQATGVTFYKGVDRTLVVEAMSNVPLSDEHYEWLQKTFGDPASVVATREGFDVEFYEDGY